MLQNLHSKSKTNWHIELGIIYHINTWDSLRKMNRGIRYHNRLRWLQYRILVKNLHTNDILSRYRRDVQNFCSFCTRERETISHLFYNCNIVRQFYTTLSNLLLQLGLYFEINVKKCLFEHIDIFMMNYFDFIMLGQISARMIPDV